MGFKVIEGCPKFKKGDVVEIDCRLFKGIGIVKSVFDPEPGWEPKGELAYGIKCEWWCQGLH